MISSVNKILLNSNKIRLNNNNILYNSISNSLLINNNNNNNNNNNYKINISCNSIFNNTNINNNNSLNKYYSSKNYNNFSHFKQKRKYYEEQYQKQQQEKRERDYYHQQSKEQEYQFREQQHQQQQYQQPSIFIPIFKVLFKIVGQILFGWIRNKFAKTEYKELYNFTKETIYHQRRLIQNSLGLNQNILINLEPKIVSTQFVPRHSIFMNQEDQVMMVCEIPTPRNISSSLHVVTLARSLPDRVETSNSFFSIFTSVEAVKCAEPIRVTLLVDNETIGPFGFPATEKREILLYNNENYANDGFGSHEYDIFERKQQQQQQDDEEDEENGQYYQEKHQNRNSSSNSNSNRNNNRETIVLDPKDFHEVTNNKK